MIYIQKSKDLKKEDVCIVLASSSQSSYTNNRIQKLENLLGNLVAVLKVRFAEDPQINQVLEAIDQEV